MGTYEQQVEENRLRNLEKLQSLGVISVRQQIDAEAGLGSQAKRVRARKKSSSRSAVDYDSDDSRCGEKDKRLKAEIPSRKSRRAAGLAPELKLTAGAAEIHDLDLPEFIPISEEESRLLPCSEYFQANGIVPVVISDYHFHGWVEEGVRLRCGIAENAEAAWESEGGGTFSFRNPLGNGTKESSTAAADGDNTHTNPNPHPIQLERIPLKPKAGWSQARIDSFLALRKNPNAFFYRHTEPGVEEWNGEWAAEEEALFVEAAKKWGIGDKWGLFSSHIPHRVGYTCAQYYRNVAIPNGIVEDDRYVINASGKASWRGEVAPPRSVAATATAALPSECEEDIKQEVSLEGEAKSVEAAPADQDQEIHLHHNSSSDNSHSQEKKQEMTKEDDMVGEEVEVEEEKLAPLKIVSLKMCIP